MTEVYGMALEEWERYGLAARPCTCAHQLQPHDRMSVCPPPKPWDDMPGGRDQWEADRRTHGGDLHSCDWKCHA